MVVPMTGMVMRLTPHLNPVLNLLLQTKGRSIGYGLCLHEVSRMDFLFEILIKTLPIPLFGLIAFVAAKLFGS